MNLIVANFIRRWWFLYALSLLIHLVVLFLDDGKMDAHGFDVFGTLFCGLVLLSFDLIKGSSRVFLSLPVKRRAIASAYWIISIGLPVLITIGMNLLSILVARQDYGHTTFLLLRPWFVLSTCGILLLLMTVSSPGYQHGFWRNIFAGLVGIAWGGFMGGALFLLPRTTIAWGQLHTEHWIFLGLGTIAAVAGQWTSEHLLVHRATFATSQGSQSNKPIQRVSTIGVWGGWKLLWWMQFSQVFLFGIGATIILLGLDLLSHNGNLSERSVIQMLPVQVGFFACILYSMRWAFCMRVFKLIPITSSRLAFLLIAMSILPGLAFTLLSTGLLIALASHISMRSLWCVGLLMAGFSSVVLPVSLSLHKSRSAGITMILPILIVMLISPAISETMTMYSAAPVELAGAICAVLVITSLISLRHMLRNHNECYHSQVVSFPQA